MRATLLIILSASIALLISLLLPDIEILLRTCKLPFVCGVDLDNILKFLGKTDTAALELGHRLYQKIVSGIVAFVVTLFLSSLLFRRYLRSEK